MSSSNYRGRRGGGSRDSYSKPRRYWESDDYYKRGYDRDYDRGRGRRSRSRSRDRSYSRSRSKSRSRSPRKNASVEPYQPKPAPSVVPVMSITNTSMPIPTQKVPSPYDPMYALHSGWTPVDNIPQIKSLSTTNGQPQYFLGDHYQQPNIVSSHARVKENPLANEYGTVYHGFKDLVTESYLQSYTPAPVGSTARTTEESSENSAKILKKNKEKKRRSSSTSSSSSSSSDSSGSKEKRRGKKKQSSESSSDSSSDNEKKSKKKEKKIEAVVTISPVSSNLSKQQREALEKQYQGYKSKLDVLQREIKRLVAKEDELASMKADMKLIEENLKLQTELKSRTKAVTVVLEKIQDVIRGGSISADGKPRPPPPPPPKLSQPIAPPAPIIHQVQQVTLVSTAALPESKVVHSFGDLDFFDNGIHWCRLCNTFPESVTELLDHFHSDDHHIQVEQLGIEEQPWHKKNSKETKSEPGAKKVPFRGMQFFTPVKGWYCKICSSWMGDHHCALEHLKSEEHYNSFANFLIEHPEWESKYATDREKARYRAGLGPDVKKAGVEAIGGDIKYNPLQGNCEEDGKSIFVQMRRKAKEEEESRSASHQQNFPPSSTGKSKDTATVDEWMGKPQKVAVDIIDTQKFAAIVRQKHGATNEKDEKKAPPPPQIHENVKKEDREKFGSHEVNKTSKDEYHRKPDLRVELSMGSGRDRDRGRDRGRRRSRSKSRSKSRSRGRYDRDRDRHGSRRRSSRDRSRSRERERSRDKDRRRDLKPEVVKRLPIIGKMPLFGKKTALNKKENSVTTSSETVTSEYGPVVAPMAEAVDSAPMVVHNPYDASGTGGIHVSNAYAYGYPTMAIDSFGGAVGYPYTEVPAALPAVEPEPLKPPGEKETPTLPVPAPIGRGTGLPDDFQHALDIIYHGVGGKPGVGPKAVTFTPPVEIGPTLEEYSVEYSESFNYMDYQPYHQDSFEGYGPADYPDMESVPYTEPGVEKPVKRISVYDSDPPASDSKVLESGAGTEEDDMEDLRMLGIDVEDTAASNFK